jgi:hypothetical protein
MLQPNFDPMPTAVRIHRCGYVSPCKARGCPKRATLIAEKVDTAGRHVLTARIFGESFDAYSFCRFAKWRCPGGRAFWQMMGAKGTGSILDRENRV